MNNQNIISYKFNLFWTTSFSYIMVIIWLFRDFNVLFFHWSSAETNPKIILWQGCNVLEIYQPLRASGALFGPPSSCIWQLITTNLSLTTIDIERRKNRLLEFCYVPTTSTAHNRLLFFLFCVAIYSSNEANKAGCTHH